MHITRVICRKPIVRAHVLILPARLLDSGALICTASGVQQVLLPEAIY